MANFVLLLLLFIIHSLRTYSKNNYVWIVKLGRAMGNKTLSRFWGIKISKFITDPYNLTSLHFILAIFVGKATQTQGGVPFLKALFPLQSDTENYVGYLKIFQTNIELV